jgi:hypothetical protein
MGNFTRGQNFAVTEQVTNTKLHNLIENATISDIVNAEISATAAIADTKLGTISTSSKVSGSALFNLSSVVSTAGSIPNVNLPTSILQNNLAVHSLASINQLNLGILINQFSTAGTLTSLANSLPTEDKIKRYIDGEIDAKETLRTVVAGDVLNSFADTEGTDNNTSYELQKSIQIPVDGTLRIKFDIKKLNPAGSKTAYGRVYRNGSPVGTEQSKDDDTSYETFSEDISGWSNGDLCQLYTKSQASDGSHSYRNFRIYADITPDYYVLTDG